MNQITDRFWIQNPDLDGMTFEAAASFGRLICAMPASRQEKLLLEEIDVFTKVAPILGSTIECTPTFQSCINQLAKIAVSEDGFGDVKGWNAHDVSSLGILVAGQFHSCISFFLCFCFSYF